MLYENIIKSVGDTQVPQKRGHVWVPAAPDSKLVNTDHIPFYRDMVGSCSWTAKGDGGGQKRGLRGQVARGGGEKDRFTMQVTITKNGKKLRPFVIFKAQPANGVRENNRNAFACQLKHRTPDAACDEHPPEDEVFLTCNTTANSNYEFTNMILKEAVLPELGC